MLLFKAVPSIVMNISLSVHISTHKQTYGRVLIINIDVCIEAASKLEIVSEECKKTEDVDIDGMLTNTNQCIQCLNELADVETNKTRLVSTYFTVTI